MRTVLLLLTLSLLAACGTTAGKCSISNCTGCCDTTGQCQVGNSNLTCGSGAAQCQPCANTQACTFGVCVTQSTSGGGSGGGSGGSSGGGTGGGTGGGVTGGGGGSSSCTPSNCAGCCDSVGRCQTGLSATTCGAGGVSCAQCQTSQTCNAGTCRNQTGGGGGSSCSAATCPSGCCTPAGVCITNTSPSRCGSGGNACSTCGAGNTCVGGACQPCAGCVDINSGACLAGTTNTTCGHGGGFCQACDQGAGQSCNSGTCSGGTTCNGNNCSGCCDGNSCVLPGSFTNAQCGQGIAGAACTTCIGGASCRSGVCSSPSSDAGLPDGGFVAGCVDSTECGAGECCDSFGTAIPGACISSGTACQFGGANFQICVFLGSCTCNGLTQTCE